MNTAVWNRCHCSDLTCEFLIMCDVWQQGIDCRDLFQSRGVVNSNLRMLA